MPDNLIKRGNVYYARIQVDGRDIRKSLRTSNRAEAKSRLKEMLARHSPYHGTSRKTFDQVAAEYMLETSLGVTPKTLARYQTSLDMLTDHFGGMSWDRIDKQAVIGYIEERKRAKVSVRTIKNDLSVLSGAAQYAMERDWAGTNPVAAVGKRTLRYRPAVFQLPPDGDIELVLAHVNGPLEQMCRFLRHTGMRRDEAVYLRWNDVDRQREAATLPDTKNGTTRTVSLSANAMALIDTRPRLINSPFIFPRNDGEPYKGASLGFREAKRRAKLVRPYKAFRLHDLRHIYAIEYLRGGGNLYALQKQLGHGSIRQTEFYLQHLTPEEQEAAKSSAAQTPAQMHRFPIANGGENG